MDNAKMTAADPSNWPSALEGETCDVCGTPLKVAFKEISPYIVCMRSKCERIVRRALKAGKP